MKRAGQLMNAIAAPDNLRLAFWKAAKGKRGKADCRIFRENLDANLEAMRGDLLSGEVEVGEYRYFTIHDPKERRICAASFRERVLHHALMNVCEPVLERAAVFDSYACRKGKGRLAAIARAQEYAGRHDWHLKVDVRKYFDSIDHETLRVLLRQRFKDTALLDLFDRILGSYQTGPGRGLPIGNLTSQHFANFYLGPLDRFIKEDLGRQAYARYMDDSVVWGGSGRELREVCERVRDFVAARLRLDLKPNVAINRTALGLDFLGYRVFPHLVRLARRSKVRFARKFRGYEAAHLAGDWSELELQQRVTALLAFVMPAESQAYRRRVLERFACVPDGEGQSNPPPSAQRGQGGVAIGLEPRDPRRQLEQQRDQLPDGEPQQQLAGQQEQQPGLPVRPAPSSIPQVQSSGADPATLPSRRPESGGQRPQAPPGVSSPDGCPGERSGRGAPPMERKHSCPPHDIHQNALERGHSCPLHDVHQDTLERGHSCPLHVR